MEFGLRNGPWRTVFEGVFQKHEMQVLSNPDETMLVFIYEKEGQETTGLLMQAFSVYSVSGETEAFLERLQREAVTLSRHDGNRTSRFLAIASKPSYSRASSEEVAKGVDMLLEEVKQAGSKAVDVASSFELELTPLAKSGEAMKQAFFSQPIVLPMLARESKEKEEEKGAEIRTGSTGAAAVLGITKEGKQVREPLEMFQRVIVSDGTEPQRNHFIQVLVESFLLANIPAVVFDEGNGFEGLSQPTKKAPELHDLGISADPIGFPTKDFYPGKSVKVNLNGISPAGFLNLFGCSSKEAEKILKEALEKGGVEGIDHLVRNIESITTENSFLKKRVERIAALAGEIYPGLFAGETDVDEMLKTWFEKIGRTSIVHTDDLDPRAFTLLLDSLSRELLEAVKKKGETGKPKLLVAIPSTDKLFSIRDNLVQVSLVSTLKEMKRFGAAFVVAAGKRSDLGREILQASETKIAVVKENDTAIDLPNSKNYRLATRPTLSQSKAG